MRGGRRVWPWVAAGAFALLAALLALAPSIVAAVDWPEYVRDVSDSLPEEIRGRFTNGTVRVKVRLERSGWCGLSAKGTGLLLDWPFTFESQVGWSLFALSAEGSASFGLDGTGIRGGAEFSASARRGWNIDVAVPETEIGEGDGFTAAALRRIAPLAPSVSNIVVNGKMRFAASASTTNSAAVPVWEADAWIKGLDVSLVAAETPVAVSGFGVHAGATGIGGHVDVKPAFPHATLLEAAGFALSNAFASVRATETSLLVTEAGADVCGGKARVYSLFLNPERLDAGFTLLLDDIDAGLALGSISAFEGTATGRLHGKLPLRIRGGEGIVFGDSYLHSIPGETGTIRIGDATPVLDSLAAAGVPAAERANLAKAVKNLSYSVLNLSLEKEGERSHALGFKLEGTATDGGKTVPVSFGVTLHGELQELVNTGLKAQRRKAEK